MSRNPKTLTIHHAQKHQPWTVPYRKGVAYAQDVDVPHILGSHAVLHAAKSLGKLAAVFEALDHAEQPAPSVPQLKIIADMAADLVTAALRLGNLYDFEVATMLVERVREKNSKDIIEWPAREDAKEMAAAGVVAMNAAAGLHPAHACTCNACLTESSGVVVDCHLPECLPDCKRNCSARDVDPDKVARTAYYADCDNGPIHPNRCSTWDELPPKSRQYWREKVSSAALHPVSECAARGCGGEVPDITALDRLHAQERARLMQRVDAAWVPSPEQREAMLEGGSEPPKAFGRTPRAATTPDKQQLYPPRPRVVG